MHKPGAMMYGKYTTVHCENHKLHLEIAYEPPGSDNSQPANTRARLDNTACVTGAGIVAGKFAA